MNKNYWITLSLVFCLCLLLVAGGCEISMGGWPQAKYERTVQKQVPLAAGSTVVTETSFGSVTVVGADVTDCNVTAKIFAQAPTEQEAQEIAEQVQIKLEQIGNTLEIMAERSVFPVLIIPDSL